MDRLMKILRAIGLVLIVANQAVLLRKHLREAVNRNPLADMSPDDDPAATNTTAFERAAERLHQQGGGA